MRAANAEGNCPPGQYPIGGQGAAACAPIPQSNTQQPAQPSGRWLKTWGAISIGFLDSATTYGITTGKPSKAEAEADALRRCASQSETTCRVGLTYENQCAVIVEPHINGKPYSTGIVRFIGRKTVALASRDALEICKKDNKSTPEAQCEIVYSNCTEQVFQQF